MATGTLIFNQVKVLKLMVYQRINLKSTRIPALAMMMVKRGLVVKNSGSKNPIRKQGLKFVYLADRCHDTIDERSNNNIMTTIMNVTSNK